VNFFQEENVKLSEELQREPSIGASNQISVHFGKAVSEKIFRNQPI
jgi:hypothetical protein